MINGMDVSDILIDEWSNNYWGFQQASKFRALATAKHFIQFCDGQIVITYGEFIAENRPIYYLTKVERPLTTFVSIQHGMNARNKTFTYHRRCEFNYNGIGYGVENSPFPDYFLTQGRQYEIFLKEFYESNRITTIGSLKSTNSESKKPNKSLQLNKVLGLKKRLLLIAPSVGEEYKGLIDLFSDWSYYNDWILVVSSHPASPIDRIAKYQINKFPDMRVSYITDASTVDIIKYCNLVVVGYSVLALEALQSNIAAVRYVPLGVFPQFDKDVQVPSFHNKHQFVEWFELFCNDIHQDSKVEYTKIAQKYIFKNDNRAGNRLWEFICKLHK